MGYTEKEILKMTHKKFMVLFTEYQKINGTYEKPPSIEDFVP